MPRNISNFDPVMRDLDAYLDREDREPETDPELDSLEETPEGMGLLPERLEAVINEYLEAA